MGKILPKSRIEWIQKNISEIKWQIDNKGSFLDIATTDYRLARQRFLEEGYDINQYDNYVTELTKNLSCVKIQYLRI